MLRPLIAGAMLIALASCGKEEAKAPEAEADVTPQIASLEDYGLPADKSDQITSIDAATGDAGGMPRDGGGVVVAPKPVARPAVEPAEAAPASATAPAPMVVPPPVASPSLTVPVGN